MSRAAAILKNTAANYIQQIVAVVVFMFLTPYAARLLGTEQFGLWSLMWSMVGVLGLIDMGVSSATVKFIADARGRKLPERVSQLCSTFFWVQNGLALCVILLAAALIPLLDNLFDIPDHFTRTGAIVFGLLSFRVASGMPFGLFAGLLAAHHKQAYSSFTKSAGTLTYGLCVFLALKHQPTAVTLASCNILAHLLTNVIIIVLATRSVPDFSMHPRNFRRGLVKEISSFSGTAFLVQVSSLLYTRVDTFIIQRFLALAAVARYSVAMQTISRGSLFCYQMNSAIIPHIAEMQGANDEQAIRLVLRKGTKINTALSTPLMGGLIWLAADLIHAWMGPEFAPSILPMRLLAGAAWLDAVSTISANVLTMTGHQKQMAKLKVAGQLVNVVLTLLLVKHYGIGGVALASLVAGGSINIATIFSATRIFNVSPLRTYGPALASALPFGAMVGAITALKWFIRTTGTTQPTLLHVALMEAVGCVVFFIAFYFLGCSKKERRYYRDKLAAPLARLGIKV
jgi:O-antigen/teichoic acid export membrane protein